MWSNISSMTKYKFIELLTFIVDNVTYESKYEDFSLELTALDNLFVEDTEFDNEAMNAWLIWQNSMEESKGVIIEVKKDIIVFINVLTKIN